MPNGKFSTTRIGTFEHTNLLNDTNVGKTNKGILYKYYNKEYESAKNISGIPASSGTANKFSIPDSIAAKDWFGLVYSGYINISKDDVYTFYLKSNDGAILYIDNHLVINNDGYHFGTEKSGQIGLKKGFHSIQLSFFNGKYGAELSLKLKSKQSEKKEIPEEMLVH